MKKKQTARLLALLAALTMLLGTTSCGPADPAPSGGASNESSQTGGDSTSSGGENSPARVDKEKAYGAYAEPITITVGAYQWKVDGDYKNNAWIDLLREEYNINIEYKWILPYAEHLQKVAMATAADELPDVFFVFSVNDIRSLWNAGQLTDLNPFREYFGDLMQDAYGSWPDDSCLGAVSVDGHLAALPSTGLPGQHSLLWVRRDWLEAVGKEVPKTLDDVIDVATAFVNDDPDQNGKNDTFGIKFGAASWGTGNGELDPFFWSMGSYPRTFQKDADGKVFYGSTTNETRAALEKLSDLYRRKVIHDSAKVANNKYGLLVGPWWAPVSLKASFDNNPDADWICLSAPLNSEGKYTVPQTCPIMDGNGHLVVSKNCKNPEALIKCINVKSALNASESAEVNEDILAKYATYEEKNTNVIGNFIDPMILERYDCLTWKYNAMKDALDTGDPSKLTKQMLEAYKKIVEYNEDPIGATADQWSEAKNYLEGMKAQAGPETEYLPVALDVRLLPEDLMTKYMEPMVEQHEYVTFGKIITGEEPITAFDTWVQQFYDAGGREVLDGLQAFLDK